MDQLEHTSGVNSQAEKEQEITKITEDIASEVTE